jgi:exopolysaccharide production protein ExoQ
MPKTPTGSPTFGRPRTSAAGFDACALVTVLAFAYSAITQPLIYFFFPPTPGYQGLLESRIENRFFWPAAAAIAVALAARSLSRGGRLNLPPNIIGLLLYLGFAGASVAWAFNPELSFIRFTQEVMVLTAIVLPALLAAPTADILRGVFLCFAFGTILNVVLIPGGYATFAQYGPTLVDIGYQGYFSDKNLLGEFSAAALLLSIHELLNAGHRRALGIVIAVAAVVLLFLSSSKTGLGLALIAPCLAGLTLMIARSARIPLVLVLLSMVLMFITVSHLTGLSTERIAFMLTGDSSFTGRVTIWNFAESEIPRSPLVGWGYQSFWFAGPGAPSILDAPGWVKYMPNSHNGYYDAILELGYAGLAFLAVFLIATLHVIGRVAEYDPRRAWLLLTVALFIIVYNFLETLWLRAFDLLWVVFVIVAVEAARHWHRSAPSVPAHQSAAARPMSRGRTKSAWRPRLGVRS